MLPRKVCFVCGGAGATNVIHMHPRDDGPYFPFLSNHEPPKGARPLSRQGTVESCSVCFLFLNQQWDSYEQTKTPVVKRVYWLKRLDNGAFTGAEMKLQGEYAAQLMGLQYHPSGSGTLSPYDFNFFSSQGIACNNSSLDSPPKSQSTHQAAPLPPQVVDDDGALDLSVSSTPTPTSIPTAKTRTPKKPSTSEVRGNQRDPSPRLVESASIICYICQKEYPSSLGRFIYAAKYTDDEPFFPFLLKLPFPPGAMPLTKHGLTRACSHCRKTLSRQWRFFESNKVCEEQRIYQINDKPILVGRMAQVTIKQEKKESGMRCEEGERDLEGCYLCAELCRRAAMKVMYTRQPEMGSKHTMYFPFIGSLRRPAQALPIDQEGKVMACRACYSYLQRQWQVFQTDNVPMALRKFLLRPIHEGLQSTENANPPPCLVTSCERMLSESSQSPQQPLNIQISSAAVPQPSPSRSSGLLAIAQPSVAANVIPSSGLYASPLIYPSGFLPTYHLPLVAPPAPTVTPSTSLHPEQPKEGSYNCYICGWSSPAASAYHLRVTGHCPQDSQQEPFFPFLASYKPSAGANPIGHDGMVQCCYFCYHSFISQWTEFEKSSDPTQQNHWLRQYHTKSFICYTCGQQVSRDMISCVRFNDFPYLRGQPKAAGAVRIQVDDAALVCSSCGEMLKQHCAKNQHHLATAKLSLSRHEQTAAKPSLSHHEQTAAKPSLSHHNQTTAKPSLSHHNQTSDNLSQYEQTPPKLPQDHYGRTAVKLAHGLDVMCAAKEGKSSIKDSMSWEKQTDDGAVADEKGMLMKHFHQSQNGRGNVKPSVRQDVGSDGSRSPAHQHPCSSSDSTPPPHSSSHSSASGRPKTDLSDDEDDVDSPDGLPSVTKHPPLTMLNNAVTRTTATVTPLNPVSPNDSITSVSSISSTRASSFAAALRKLAKQAGDPDPTSLAPSHDKPPNDVTCNPPPANLSTNSPRDLPLPPPKRTHHTPYSNSQSANSITSPPVVTIAPSLHSYQNADSRKERVLSGVSGDLLGTKSEHGTVSAADRARDDERPLSKDSATSSTARITPHSISVSSTGPHLAGSLSTPGDDTLPARGFQPYRSSEDLLLNAARAQHAYSSTASPFGGMDPALYSAYHSAFAAAAAAPHPFSHPAFRMDDPMLLERYRMMQQPLFPYPPTSTMLPSPLHPLMPHFSRYPGAAELLAASSQALPYLPPGAATKLPDHLSPNAPPSASDRSKCEDEVRREREREVELERERDRARQREERDRLDRREREKQRQKAAEQRERKSPAMSSALKQEDLGSRLFGSSRDVYTSGVLNYSTNTAKTSGEIEAVRTEEKERERQLLHQQFVREQDQLRGHGQPHQTGEVSHKKPSSSPHHLPAKPTLTEYPLTSHLNKTDTKANSGMFHRPFEKNIPNGYEKAECEEKERVGEMRFNSVLSGYNFPPSETGRSNMASSPRQTDVLHGRFHNKSPHHVSKPHTDTELLSRAATHGSEPSSLINRPTPHDSALHASSTSSQESGPHSEFTYQLPGTGEGGMFRSTDQASRKSPHSRQDHHRNPGRDKTPDVHHSQRDHHGDRGRDRQGDRSRDHHGDRGRDHHGDRGRDHHGDRGREQPFREHKHLLNITSHGSSNKSSGSQSAINHLDQFVMKSVQEKRTGDAVVDRHCKRRRLYHTPASSNHRYGDYEVERPNSSPLLLATPHPTSSDSSLTTPDYKHKSRFLTSLGLEPIPPERRLELEYIRKVCEWDRSKRNGMKCPLPPAQCTLTPPQQLAAAKSSQPSQMNPCRPRHPVDSEANVPLSQPLPASPHPHGLTPARSHRQARDGRTPSPHEEGVKQAAMFGGDSPRHRAPLSKEFAQEFHQSVLQTTRQQQQENRAGSVSKESGDVGNSRVSGLCDRPSGSSSSGSHVAERRRASSTDVIKWPGIEALIESYHAHADDQRLERQVLVEECKRLKQENRSLNATAESLSTRMAELLEKRSGEKVERQSRQTSLDLVNAALLALSHR